MLLLPAILTIREAREARRMLAQALQREAGSAVTVDASGLRQFDTAALAVLLECRRLAREAGKDFVLRDAPGQLAELARLYGVDGLLLAVEAQAEGA